MIVVMTCGSKRGLPRGPRCEGFCSLSQPPSAQRCVRRFAVEGLLTGPVAPAEALVSAMCGGPAALPRLIIVASSCLRSAPARAGSLRVPCTSRTPEPLACPCCWHEHRHGAAGGCVACTAPRYVSMLLVAAGCRDPIVLPILYCARLTTYGAAHAWASSCARRRRQHWRATFPTFKVQ